MRSLLAVSVLVAAVGVTGTVYHLQGTDRAADESVAHPLRIAVSRTPLSAPAYIAQAKGYFLAEGLDVEVEELNGGYRCLLRVLEGEAELATVSEMPVAMQAFERSDFALLATFVSSRADLKVVARADAGVATAADLAGRRIGMVPGTSAHFFLDSFLLLSGVPRESVEFVALKPEEVPAAVKDGVVDAAAIWEPVAYHTVAALGPNAVVLPPLTEYRQTFNLVGRRQWISMSHETAVRALRAMRRADRFIAERPEEAMRIVQRRLGLDAELMAWIWSGVEFRLALDQELFTTLEAEARWAISTFPERKGSAMPDYLQYLVREPLASVAPHAVGVL